MINDKKFDVSKHEKIKYDQYKVSLIIPIYNQSEYLKTCLESILEQSMDYRNIEVLMIDDGSKDNSLEIMKAYSRKYNNFKCFTKENEGLSKTRNFGIRHATGKYIMYLDPDDYFGKDTIKNVCDFFDDHFDEIDVVTFKIIPVRNGIEQKLHFRYDVITETGVYDLKELKYSYICHTNINTCVKNRFSENILFSETEGFRHEDQKYNIDTLREKEKIGYCADAEYYYIRHNDSITGTYFHAYYIFESTILFWESELSRYKEHTPFYIQALFISDINWKLRSNILLPYHYSEEEYSEAWNRIVNLLEKCDNELIINHPNVNKSHILYWLTKKKSNNIFVEFNKDSINTVCNGEIIHEEEKIRIVITRYYVCDGSIYIRGIVKPLYCSVVQDIDFKIVCNEKEYTIPIELKNSSKSRVITHEVTNNFYYFDFEVDCLQIKDFKFLVSAGGYNYNVDIHFGNRVPFSHGRNGTFIRNNNLYLYNYVSNAFSIRRLNRISKLKKELGLFARSFRKQKKFAVEQSVLSFRKKRVNEIWLYYDCKGLGKDNGYYQFEHDVNKNDGIERYYVFNDDHFDKNISQFFPKELHEQIVEFGSKQHVKLFLMASVLITAYIENVNIIPMKTREFKKYSRVVDFPRIVYLQHGILHAHTPWKYSLDNLNIDREVISSKYEEENLTNNYGFEKKDLIYSGMPRYDYIDAYKRPKKRILFAPTWRNYLVKRNGDSWDYNVEDFKKSRFYSAILSFLNDSRLDELLKKHNYYMDVKLHPIFSGYNKTFSIDSNRIRMCDNNVDISEYEVFITDFSSFVFDAVYLCRGIMYFIPDYDLFKSGMNGYNELDLPIEDAFGPFVQNEEDAVNALSDILEGKVDSKYKERMESFFMFKDNNQRERVYNGIRELL